MTLTISVDGFFEIASLTESTHDFSYQFFTSATLDHSLSVAADGMTVLSLSSSLGFTGDALQYQQVYLLTDRALRQGDGSFWSRESSILDSAFAY